MTPDEFADIGHRMIDVIADYMRTVESMAIMPDTKPGEVYDAFPSGPPDMGDTGDAGDWSGIFADIQRSIIPNITHWQHPSFFGYFPCNASGPGILGELLAAGLGVQGMLWQTSPACTELETLTLDWLVDLLGLPDNYHSRRSDGTGGGVIQHTASDATLVAMLAGRQRQLRAGASPDAICVYASQQAHSSIVKAAMVAGLAKSPEDTSSVRLIATDAQHRMDPAALAEALREDVLAGRAPAFVCATLGTPSSEAVDPIDKIATAIDEVSASTSPRPWLHVDAAYTGAALVCPEHRHLAKGLDRAESFCFNPHKWLLTNFDCDTMFTSDAAGLTAALSITPEYLRNQASDDGAVIDYRDWHVPLGRKFRSLKLWMVLRHYGRGGLQAYIRNHVAIAASLEQRVARDPRFELAAPRTTALVCLRLAPPGTTPERADALTRSLMDSLNATGEVFLTHTTLTIADQNGAGAPRFVLRIAVGGTHTEQRHGDHLWQLLTEHADQLIRSRAT